MPLFQHGPCSPCELAPEGVMRKYSPGIFTICLIFLFYIGKENF